MRKTLFSLILLSGFIVSCQDKSQPNVELIQDMMDQPPVKAQRDGGRVPPENTKPVGFQPYKYAMNIDGAARDLKNPFDGKVTPEVLKIGMKHYETSCKVCHGNQGEGNGHLRQIGKYPLPIPSLLSAKVRGWKDGNIYHVITVGQGTMGPYASHVPQNERWHLVSYIRQLQSEQGVK